MRPSLAFIAADFKALGQKPEEVFEDAVRTTPAMVARFQQAEALTASHVAADFSYKNRALVSPRVVRVGDAAGFIDPIFSSGVMLAMNSGMAGARAVDEAITAGQAMTAGMRRYEKQVWQSIGVFWKFIERFYDHNFTQLFFQPVNRFRMVCAINCVLAGRTKLPLDVRWRLGVFFFLVRLNRLIPVVPRIRVG